MVSFAMYPTLVIYERFKGLYYREVQYYSISCNASGEALSSIAASPKDTLKPLSQNFKSTLLPKVCYPLLGHVKRINPTHEKDGFKERPAHSVVVGTWDCVVFVCSHYREL